ncbi:hypothetical protein BHECKSOX_1034 [Bathymodiolus heckerae thiotrophic gill symbiont]|uniref:TorD/DmsD family molecular chaperone n=1 Tax=Bathymodiolus heckerae thiotrophic gill symbiont TaxID=1052212 RepID=UPI0010AF9D37|nr:molecular chaperone TorD family protein [Bathymodiolus heckerae thiotrophic gill symbiont]SHN90772.1 hypothetical protein BHECKSOX_1034 [Bathymodiolus heckerae thiotrophic gill symbiont]
MKATINNTTKNADSSCHLEAERSNIYALLSAILIAPANSNLIDIINDCHINTDTWQALKDNFNHENLESLDDEYHRLFIGLGTGELLPYYSHYLAGCLMGKPLSNLRDDIRAMGLESQDTQKDPTDHIAGVFEVMRLSISGLSLSLEQQKIFFEKNIASWVDDFFNDLSKIEKVKHYHLVAYFGQWFMQTERRYFNF